MGEDFISWQNLCPIPFVNLTNKIIINYKAFNLINCRVLHRVKNTRKFHSIYLFFPKTKKMSLLHGPSGFKMSYFLL